MSVHDEAVDLMKRRVAQLAMDRYELAVKLERVSREIGALEAHLQLHEVQLKAEEATE